LVVGRKRKTELRKVSLTLWLVMDGVDYLMLDVIKGINI
jgi:hypothetical protein